MLRSTLESRVPMASLRIALANLRFPDSAGESVTLATQAVQQAADDRAGIVCFPECYVPGYRTRSKNVPPPDEVFLKHAWSSIAGAAGKANVGVILGTERFEASKLLLTAVVINPDGS